MLSFPNAKINLGLHITAKRPDGFHDLESCFYPVGWTEVLEIIESDALTFTSSGLAIPGDADNNLCIKAYQALEKDFGLPPVHIHLHKAIPIGAGLGGGSADAAFAVKLLNAKFDLRLTDDQLEDYARPLGSDCAFFVRNQPRFAYGKGDCFEETPDNLHCNPAALLGEKSVWVKQFYGFSGRKLPCGQNSFSSQAVKTANAHSSEAWLARPCRCCPSSCIARAYATVS